MESPREIAALVPMPELLAALGIPVHTRTHRAPCMLHGGSNPTAFSWRDDGRWHCFSCDSGGDRIDLVRAARECSFPEALGFLAEMAGVKLNRGTSGQRRYELDAERLERDRVQAAADRLRDAELQLELACCARLRRAELIRGYAEGRLKAIHNGTAERFPGEADIYWQLLAMAHDRIRMLTAAYTVIGFADHKTRKRFVLRPRDREQMISAALNEGWVRTDRGGWMEILR